MNCNDCGGFLPGGCECSPFGGRRSRNYAALQGSKGHPELPDRRIPGNGGDTLAGSSLHRKPADGSCMEGTDAGRATVRRYMQDPNYRKTMENLKDGDGMDLPDGAQQ